MSEGVSALHERLLRKTGNTKSVQCLTAFASEKGGCGYKCATCPPEGLLSGVVCKNRGVPDHPTLCVCLPCPLIKEKLLVVILGLKKYEIYVKYAGMNGHMRDLWMRIC